MTRFRSLLFLGVLAAVPAPSFAQAVNPGAATNAPEASSGSEWSIKPRGRIQLDWVDIDAPATVVGEGFGTETEVRRAYLGVDGTLPGNLGFRVEADFAGEFTGEDVQFTDVYLTYKPSDELTFTLGQHKAFFALEEQTSDLFTSMLERAAFTSAFGFERRIGLSGAYSRGDLLVQAGAFTVHTADLDDDDDSYGFDGRVVFSPKVGAGELHIGASAHLRELQGADAGTVRYRARPFAHTTDTRLIDTGSIAATGERSFGAELAYIAGPFHATVEGHRITALRPGLPNPSFWGGYAEVGMLVTPGDKTGYRGGVYDRIKPANPVTEGGIGAIQLNARYDRLDLNDGAITGGQQEALGLSVIWVPVASVRVQANYGRLWISDARIPAGTDRDYRVDTLGMRAQFDF
jgi:phosphate-selective porin OprO/OprP